MPVGRTIFAQLMERLPRFEFTQCVQRYRGDLRMRTLSCWEQFLALAYAQLTGRESLRDIETCLLANRAKLYHSGFRAPVRRSTLADANESRDWRIFADFARVLLARAVQLHANDDFGVPLTQAAYALDSTTIDLCLALFPWARLGATRAAVKLHTQLALHGNIPTVFRITPARLNDVHFMDEVVWEAGAFYVIDRGYLDFARFRLLHEAQAYFVTRARCNFRFRRRYSRPVDKSAGVLFDQLVRLADFKTKRSYPLALRRIGYRDPDTGKKLIFLTNHLALPALVIARLYKARWQIELFFKWVKGHIRIKAFLGTSANAIKIQLCVALSVYALVALVRKELQLEASLYTILQILDATIFEKMPIITALSQPPLQIDVCDEQKQLCFQGFLTGQ